MMHLNHVNEASLGAERGGSIPQMEEVVGIGTEVLWNAVISSFILSWASLAPNDQDDNNFLPSGEQIMSTLTVTHVWYDVSPSLTCTMSQEVDIDADSESPRASSSSTRKIPLCLSLKGMSLPEWPLVTVLTGSVYMLAQFAEVMSMQLMERNIEDLSRREGAWEREYTLARVYICLCLPIHKHVLTSGHACVWTPRRWWHWTSQMYISWEGQFQWLWWLRVQ